MTSACCPKCYGVWFTLKTIWHPEPKFSRAPGGTVDIWYRCANCGWEWYEGYKLLDPVATTDAQTPKEIPEQPNNQ